MKDKYTLPTAFLYGEESDPESYWFLESDKEKILVHLSEAMRRPQGYLWATEFGGYIDSFCESLEVVKAYPSGSRILRYRKYEVDLGEYTQLFLCKPRENKGGFR